MEQEHISLQPLISVAGTPVHSRHTPCCQTAYAFSANRHGDGKILKNQSTFAGDVYTGIGLSGSVNL